MLKKLSAILSLLTLCLFSAFAEVSDASLAQSEPKISTTMLTLALCIAVTLIYFLAQFLVLKLKFSLSKKLLINGIGGVSVLLVVLTSFILFANKSIEGIGKEVSSLSSTHLPLNKMIVTIAEHQLSKEVHFERYLRTKSLKEKNYFLTLQNKVVVELKEASSLIDKWENYEFNDALETEKAQEAKLALNKIKDMINESDASCELLLTKQFTNEEYNKILLNSEKITISTEEKLTHFLHEIENHTIDITKLIEVHEHESEKFLFSIGASTILFGFFTLVFIWRSSSDIVSKIKLVSTALMKNSNEFSHASTSLDDGNSSLMSMTSQQVASVQGMVSALEEVHMMSKKNTDQTIMSLDKTKSCTEIALSGKSRLSEVSEAMSNIEMNMNELANQIEMNNEKVNEISGIISEISVKTSIINDIVFQTKLLSFNASVEAARAGEQGKGFAVVAEEIGTLAELSGKSASEIGQIITASIEKVNSIVSESSKVTSGLTLQNKNKIDYGKKKVEECTKTFEGVLAGVTELSQYVGEISVATKEQSEGVKSISESIKEIDASTNEVSKISEGTKKTSKSLVVEVEDLKGSSQELSDIIGSKRRIE